MWRVLWRSCGDRVAHEESRKGPVKRINCRVCGGVAGVARTLSRVPRFFWERPQDTPPQSHFLLAGSRISGLRKLPLRQAGDAPRAEDARESSVW